MTSVVRGQAKIHCVADEIDTGAGKQQDTDLSVPGQLRLALEGRVTEHHYVANALASVPLVLFHADTLVHFSRNIIHYGDLAGLDIPDGSYFVGLGFAF